MGRESISDESIDQGPPPPPLYVGTLRRRKRRPKSRERGNSDSSQAQSSGDATLPRPKRKSLKGIKGTNISVDEAKEINTRWRKSLSGPVEEELKRKGSRQSLPLGAMQELVASFPSRRLQVPEEVKEEAYKIGFNVFNKSDEELVEHVDKMMDCFSLVTIFKKKETLFNLVNGIRANYKSNPFHNFKHAFGVSQMAVVFILRDLSIAKALGKMVQRLAISSLT